MSDAGKEPDPVDTTPIDNPSSRERSRAIARVDRILHCQEELEEQMEALMTEAWKDPGPHHSGKIASLKTQIAGDQVEGTPSEASDIQPAIDAVLAQFRAKGGYDERFDTARALAGVPEGERDDTLFRLACKLRHADVPEDWAERL